MPLFGHVAHGVVHDKSGAINSTVKGDIERSMSIPWGPGSTERGRDSPSHGIRRTCRGLGFSIYSWGGAIIFHAHDTNVQGGSSQLLNPGMQ